MLITLICSLFCVKVAVAYFQSDYEVVSERFEFTFNDKYFENPKFHNFKYNRTFHALNISTTLKMDFNNDLKFFLQAYKFASNEYRLFPMGFDGNLCNILDNKLFGTDAMLKCGVPFACPIKKGFHSMCNFQLDYTKFPPYVPSGRYRLDVNLTYFSELVGQLQWYETTKRKFD